MANRNMKADMNVQFTEASSRQSIESGESVKTIFGKIRKWLSDLKPVAFSGSYNDLSNKPTTGVSGVKGNAETTYRTGNVNLTPANMGAATTAQGTKADSAVQTIQIGGTAQTKTDGVVNLPAYPTKSSLGMSNVENKSSATIRGELTSSNVTTALGYTPLNSNLKGTNSGLAELDSNGKVPSSQLPSFVDDVLEYDNKSSFPTTGETGKIYLDKATNLAWRWSGTTYVEISPSLALGETSSTAYRGDRGKAAYDHSQSTHARTDATKVESSSTNGNIKINGTETNVYTHPGSGTNPHGTTKSDVGLGNVGNFKAVSTVASQGLSDTEKANARANIGLGNVNNTSDANKPISTAAQAALDGKVNKSGGTITGNIVYKASDVDASLTNNNISATKYATTFSYEDKINRILARNEGIINPNGNVAWYTYLRNYDTSGTRVAQKGLKMEMNKSGALTWAVDDAANFRTAISVASKAQVNYNTNNGVKNLLSTEWFATNPISTQSGTIESYDVETGSITGFASASLTSVYLSINISVDKMNKVLENGKTYILSWTVDSMATNAGVFGMRRNDDNTYSVGGAAAITRTGNYSVSYTHNSSIPVYFSLCINTAGLSTDKRIAISNLMLREATIEDDTFEPYAEPNSELTAKTNAALKQTGYNLLEITSSSQTINGVTFIVDKAAGTITANGTASQGVWAPVSFGKLSAGNYILSGCPTSSFDKFSLALYENTSSSPFIVYNAGNNSTFTLPNAKNYKLQIRITAGTTLSDVVFKPMIVPAELAGVPFQPYAKSNAELTSGKLDATGMVYYKSYPEQFLARAQKGSVYYELELDTTVAGIAGLAHSSGSSIGLSGGTPVLLNSGGDRLLFNPDGCISGQPANSGSRIGLRNYGSGTYIGFFTGVPGVYDSDDIPMCTFTTSGIRMDNALISGRSGTPTLTTNTGTVYEFKDDGIYLNGTRIAP